MVETGGLENRLRGDSHGGSNPSSSAKLHCPVDPATAGLYDRADDFALDFGQSFPAALVQVRKGILVEP